MGDEQELVVLLPIYDERPSAARLVASLALIGPGSHLVLIDDGSLGGDVDAQAIAAAGLTADVFRLTRPVSNRRARAGALGDAGASSPVVCAPGSNLAPTIPDSRLSIAGGQPAALDETRHLTMELERAQAESAARAARIEALERVGRRARAKEALRPLLDLALRGARRFPWTKRVVLATASVVPPLKRKLVHFAVVRSTASVSPAKWHTDVDPFIVTEWERLLSARGL